jgi:hypothetical protein
VHGVKPKACVGWGEVFGSRAFIDHHTILRFLRFPVRQLSAEISQESRRGSLRRGIQTFWITGRDISIPFAIAVVFAV